jgi:hypothetical protein
LYRNSLISLFFAWENKIKWDSSGSWLLSTVIPSELNYPAMAYLRPKMGGIHIEVFDDAYEDSHDNQVGNIQINLTT